MRIFVGERPQLDNCFELGDQCIEKWKAGEKFHFITERRTTVRLLLEDDDVKALFYALIERCQKDERGLETLEMCADVLARLAPACQKAVVGMKCLEAVP